MDKTLRYQISLFIIIITIIIITIIIIIIIIIIINDLFQFGLQQIVYKRQSTK